MQGFNSSHPWAEWLVRLCECDSTSGREATLAPLIWERTAQMGARFEVQELGTGRLNLLASWGEPDLLFSTHLDTVPPFIAPRLERGVLYGRGSCDAKGQIAAQLAAIEKLLAAGETNLAWLGVAGEETDSLGALSALKWRALARPWRVVINGEPTGNRLATGQRGFCHLRLETKGRAAHSGMPERGENAIFPLLDWIRDLRGLPLAQDPLLGSELWNPGRLEAGNEPNVVPEQAKVDLLVRTLPNGNFPQRVAELCPPGGSCRVLLDEPPFRFDTLAGFPAEPVSFGSDAPTLAKLAQTEEANCQVYLLGPGDIATAHGPNERLNLAEWEQGVERLAELALVARAKSKEQAEVCEC